MSLCLVLGFKTSVGSHSRAKKNHQLLNHNGALGSLKRQSVTLC